MTQNQDAHPTEPLTTAQSTRTERALNRLTDTGWSIHPDSLELLDEPQPFSHAAGITAQIEAYPTTGLIMFNAGDPRDAHRAAHNLGLVWTLDISANITGAELTALLPRIGTGLAAARAGWEAHRNDNGDWSGIGTPESKAAFRRLQHDLWELHPIA